MRGSLKKMVFQTLGPTTFLPGLFAQQGSSFQLQDFKVCCAIQLFQTQEGQIKNLLHGLLELWLTDRN